MFLGEIPSVNKPLSRILFGSISIASILAILDLRNLALDKGFPLTQPKWFLLLIVIAAMGLFATFLLALTWRKSYEKLGASYDAFLSRGKKLKWILFLLFGASLLLLPLLVLHPYLGSLLGRLLWIKFFFFLLISFFAASLLRASLELSWEESLAIATLGQLLIYRLILEALYISNYPFALGWTRDSRYYDASRFFSERYYGQELTRPLINPSLYMLLSVPFIFGKLPILINRGWSVILTLGLSWVVAIKSFPLSGKMLRKSKGGILFAIWIFLYLLTGSVYAHLLLPTLIIFAFVSTENNRVSWIAIIIASIWAGVSRINWFPVPAMLAALIYLLETKVPEKKNILKYYSLPAAWFFVGTLSALLSKIAYGYLSGNAERWGLFPSLSSYMLWYRLLPNSTYALGILGGALLLSAPLLILIFVIRPKNWHPIRWLGIFLAILVLFLGGLVVSVKIGGGADLHNMDAYLISLLLVGTTLFAREFWLDSAPKHLRVEKLIPVFSVGILVLAWFILHGAGSVGYDKVGTDAVLNDLQAQSTHVASQGDEVLYISQRHLLAVGLIENIPLVADYENNFLMEMAMSQNRAYLDGFHDDLRHQKFGLIVLSPQSGVLVGEERSFGAENNVWVRKVTRPLWCYYELLIAYEGVPIELYVPRAESTICD